MLKDRRITIKNPKFLMVLPPLQFKGEEMVRPDGSLAVAYLDAALSKAGFYSKILDMSVGADSDSLEDTFYNQVHLTPTMVRIGLSQNRILEEVKDFDVIAITSIFTQQTSRCFEVSNLIRKNYPDKIIIGGGCNARTLKDHFLSNGFDVVFTSEGEGPIVKFAEYLRSGNPSISDVPGIAFMMNGNMVINPVKDTIQNIDDIPIPSWEKLPNEKYWKVGRLWGGKEGIKGCGEKLNYASIFTSRGCVFNCIYCHISSEQPGSEAGGIGKYRMHSLERVQEELSKLKSLGVNYVYINDDSFLANKKRSFAILDMLRGESIKLADVNGINIIHFFKSGKGGLVVDEELLLALYEAGFRKISLPFESGTQRIIDRYCSRKWSIDKCDTIDLIKKLNDIGIVCDGNFMIGYPDESPEELTNTFMLARKQMDAGMIGCQFFMVQPFPGSALYDESISNGQLAENWDWDEMGWSKGSMFTNPKIDKNTLKYCWSLVWKLLNDDKRVKEFSDQITSNQVKTGNVIKISGDNYLLHGRARSENTDPRS